MLAKQDVLQVIEMLPETIPYNQIVAAIDELQFIENTKKGLKDVDGGNTYLPQDVFKDLVTS